MLSVRKSLLIADRSAGSSRYSMLETIRQFAEEQLVTSGKADAVRAAHARYFAGREADILALWDSPRQLESYTWYTTEIRQTSALRFAGQPTMANSTRLSRWRITRCFSVSGLNSMSPSPGSRSSSEPATAVHHRRLAQLYVLAAQSFATGRVADALAYFDSGVQLTRSDEFDPIPYEGQYSSGVVYSVAGQLERWVTLCRSGIVENAGRGAVTRACLCIALYQLGKRDEAAAAAEGLLEEADATNNAVTGCFALLGYATAYIDSDPVTAYHSFRRALTIAQETGNRQMESTMLTMLGIVAANDVAPLFGTADDNAVDALDYLTVAIRRYHDAGNVIMVQNPLAILADVFDRLGRHEPAAIIAGFAVTEMVQAGYPRIDGMIAHLHDVLGEKVYESLARKGKAMTAPTIVTYALDEIDQVRTELSIGSK